ncbi:caspase family protein [Candidatus Dojkabacteria bacterium]|nr:caspase family protein [Candidatus Dojkabacteria bacterium]
MKKLLLFCIVFLCIAGFSQEKRIALVIGNSAYEHGGILKNPVNDANLMASVLSDLGFTVIKKTDASKSVMDAAILDFWRRLAEYDIALFYYAGHGIQVNGTNYLLPIDAIIDDDLALEIEAVDVGKVVNQFERYPDNVNIVILDACRDDPFRSWMRGSSRGFAPMNAPSGTIIGFATAPGATASDGEGLNGLYTEALVEQLIIPQRIEDVFINTRIRVQKLSHKRQIPQEWSQLTGSFFFKSDSQLNDHQQIALNEEINEQNKSIDVGIETNVLDNQNRARDKNVSKKTSKNVEFSLAGGIGFGFTKPHDQVTSELYGSYESTNFFVGFGVNNIDLTINYRFSSKKGDPWAEDWAEGSINSFFTDILMLRSSYSYKLNNFISLYAGAGVGYFMAAENLEWMNSFYKGDNSNYYNRWKAIEYQGFMGLEVYYLFLEIEYSSAKPNKFEIEYSRGELNDLGGIYITIGGKF